MTANKASEKKCCLVFGLDGGLKGTKGRFKSFCPDVGKLELCKIYYFIVVLLKWHRCQSNSNSFFGEFIQCVVNV